MQVFALGSFHRLPLKNQCSNKKKKKHCHCPIIDFLIRICINDKIDKVCDFCLLVVRRRNSLKEDLHFCRVNVGVNPFTPCLKCFFKRLHPIHVFYDFISHLDIVPSEKFINLLQTHFITNTKKKLRWFIRLQKVIFKLDFMPPKKWFN